MSDEAVLFGLTDGVATLTLNRPSSRNAITDEIADGVMERVSGTAEPYQKANYVVQRTSRMNSLPKQVGERSPRPSER